MDSAKHSKEIESLARIIAKALGEDPDAMVITQHPPTTRRGLTIVLPQDVHPLWGSYWPAALAIVQHYLQKGDLR